MLRLWKMKPKGLPTQGSMNKVLLILVWWALCCLPGCLVSTAECDQNNPCDSGQRCFQSSGTTSSGFCRDICETDAECGDPRSQICESCGIGALDYCLDEGTSNICRTCVCNPKCPSGFGCVNGICVQDREGCICRGVSCDELSSITTPNCTDETDCGDTNTRCAATIPGQSLGFCYDVCEEDTDCADPDRQLCKSCEGELCRDSRGGKICRDCTCSPSCPAEYGCVDGLCVLGAQGCLCRGQACPD